MISNEICIWWNFGNKNENPILKQTVLLDPCLSKTCTGLFCDAALFTKLFLNIQHCLLSPSLSSARNIHTNNLKHFLYQSNLFQNISSSALIQGYLTALNRSSLKFDSPSMFHINRTNSKFQDPTISEMFTPQGFLSPQFTGTKEQWSWCLTTTFTSSRLEWNISFLSSGETIIFYCYNFWFLLYFWLKYSGNDILSLEHQILLWT